MSFVGDLQNQVNSQQYVVIPPGTHVLDAPLKVPTGVTIMGYGAVLDTTASGAFILAGDGIRIMGLQLMGQAKGFGIDVQGTRFLIRDCFIEHFATGINVNGKAHDGYGTVGFVESRIEGCHVLSCTDFGIDWLSPSDSFISDCVIGNSEAVSQRDGKTGQVGIRLGWDTGGIIVRGCHVWGFYDYGMTVAGAESLISDCRMEGARMGQLQILSWGAQVRGGQYFSGGTGGGWTFGIVLGSEKAKASRAIIDTVVGGDHNNFQCRLGAILGIDTDSCQIKIPTIPDQTVFTGKFDRNTKFLDAQPLVGPGITIRAPISPVKTKALQLLTGDLKPN